MVGKRTRAWLDEFEVCVVSDPERPSPRTRCLEGNLVRFGSTGDIARAISRAADPGVRESLQWFIIQKW